MCNILNKKNIISGLSYIKTNPKEIVTKYIGYQTLQPRIT